MKKITFLLLFILPTCLYAETPATDQNEHLSFPSVACLYQTSTIEHQHGHHIEDQSAITSTWHLWRTDQQLEILNKASSQGEIWQRLKGGTVEYSWLDHNNKFKVNYPASDLKATNSNYLWATKARLISEKLLSQLDKEESKKALGFTTEKYQGKIGEYDLEVIWIPELSLPATIIQTEINTITRTELLEVYELSRAPWKPEKSEDYDDMDFSDIGDNEAHPIARSHLYGMGILAGKHRH